MTKKKTTIEDLAVMIQRGFQETARKDDVDARFMDIEKRLDRIESRLNGVEKRLDGIDQELVNIKSDTSYLKSRVSEIGNLEIEHLKDRVTTLEEKVGITR